MSAAIAAGVGAVAIGGAALYTARKNAKASDKAADAQREASDELEARLEGASAEVQGYANKYITNLKKLSNKFDPYDYKAAFESLHESIIMPLERDYFEQTLPAITSAYANKQTGGMQSGAYKETVANSRQQLGETKAKLRADERNTAFARNVDEYNRKANVLSSTLAAQTMAPTLRAQAAPTIYGAATDSIAAKLSADQASARILTDTISGALGGASGVIGISSGIKQGNLADTQNAALKQKYNLPG